jgi:hypothetical protein
MKPLLRPAALLVATGLALLALAPTARAGALAADAADCEDETLAQPFAAWADPASYTLAPGGALERPPAGWRLEGGVRVVRDNEPFRVHDADDDASLALPAGSRATTATICVGLEHPTLRLFARRTDGPAAPLLVEVLFRDATGVARALRIGALLAVDAWRPTLPLPVVANLLPLLPGNRTEVAFRFTPLDGSEWRVDDVYVDPWRMR